MINTNSKLTVREFARILKVTPRKLRRTLRTLHNDEVYTRYALAAAKQAQVRKALTA